MLAMASDVCDHKYAEDDAEKGPRSLVYAGAWHGAWYRKQGKKTVFGSVQENENFQLWSNSTQKKHK